MDFTWAHPILALHVLQEHASWARTALLGFLAYLVIHQVQYYKRTPQMASVGFPPIPIPFVAPWIAAIRFMRDPRQLVQEGVAKSKNGMFRIATFQGEYVLVTDRNKVSEYLKAPDSVLNAQDGFNDQEQIPYTMGYGVGHRPYHTAVVQGPVTRAIVRKTPDMLDETWLAFDELIGSPKVFTPVALYDTIAVTVARVSNRVYVGTEFCRNPEYLQNAADYPHAVVLSAELLQFFPAWMKGVIVQFLPVMRYRRKSLAFLRHFIQERIDGRLDENGQKPHDLVQWLLDVAPPVERTVPQVAERVLALNFASIHTITMTLSAALYSLALEPEKYLGALRQEVVENLEDGKITSSTLNNLPKMDSFLRESSRSNISGLMAMQRNARQEFRFSDGTVLPAGSKVGAPSLVLQRDGAVYENPGVFDGFRFLAPKYVDSKENTLVKTTSTFHLFGHGRHACPGRFFAANEMKIMFALFLVRYDIKLAPGDKPNPFYLATMHIPDTKLKALIKSVS